MVRGEGCYLYDADGKRYLDGCAGAYVVNVGHGVTEIADAMAAQASRVAYLNGTAFTSEPVETLARELAARAPGDLDKVYFLCSGSEASEAALKLARQYWVERGEPRKQRIIALKPSYHGNTLLAMSASARESYRSIYRDWLVDVSAIAAPYAYRCPCGGSAPDCPACTAAGLERAITAHGAGTVAAFIAEPVGGSSTGASVPRPEYWRQVREVCDRHQVLWIADEVLTGAGRTGSWTAVEQYGAVPDILTMGKGITGGYAPLSAVITSERIVDPIARGSGAFLHAQTFSFHPVLCAAGLATVRYLDAHRLVERAATMGKALHGRLAELRSLPAVGDVRGRGLLAGIEFVQDKESRTPFPRVARFTETFTAAAQEAGLMVWPNTGHADGVNGDLVCLAPPFVITDAQVDELLGSFRKALEVTLAAVTRAV